MGEFGDIVRIAVSSDTEVGKGFVMFEDPRDADDAAKTMNGKKIEKCQVSVVLASQHATIKVVKRSDAHFAKMERQSSPSRRDSETRKNRSRSRGRGGAEEPELRRQKRSPSGD